MTDFACDVFTDLLQSAHKTVEGVAFSPDSGVSSCSDSEPSSPVLSQHFTQLTNADFSAYTADSEGMPATDWLHSNCSLLSSGEDPQSGALWSTEDGMDWTDCPSHLSHLPTCVTEHTSTTPSSLVSVKGEWVETKAGFQVCHTGNGNAKVKLGGGLEYDIDINISIPDNLSPVIKTEANLDSTSGHQEDRYMNMSDNNNNINDGGVFQAYPDQSCNGCYHNRTSSYGMNHDLNYHYYAGHDAHARGENPEERTTTRKRPLVTRTERLWEFILRLLGDNKHNPRLIEWVDRSDGTFRLNNSKAIAHMWGMRKNNVQMTYEKLSRALRYYYHRSILEPVLGKKLVYRFGPNATQVWEGLEYRPQGPR